MLPIRPPVAAAPSHSTPICWEETPCLLCGRDESDVIAEGADQLAAPGAGLRFAVVQCRHCRLAYTNPRPIPDTIGRFYPRDYVPHEPRADGRTRRPSRASLRLFGRPCVERRGYLPWPGTGRLLDFGCGAGGFLQRMAGLGWRVTGIDSSNRAVESIRPDSRITTLVGTLPHADLAPGSFDVVTMWQSLEHVHQPLAVLRAAYELLVPGGRMVIAVPNIASATSRRFGEHWFGLDLPRHLTHFTPGTLSAMLGAAGLAVESLRGWVHAEWVRESASRACAAGSGGMLERLLSWKSAAKIAAWLGYAGGSADCLVAIARRPV